MSVLIAVRLLLAVLFSGVDIPLLHFFLAFKNRKYMVLVKTFSTLNLTVELCVSIEWVSKFAFYVAQGARENG